MTIQIKDMTVSQEIDMSAVRGGVRPLGDSGPTEANTWITDVLVSAAKQGPYELIATAATIPL
jgi:hypothetical protein